MSGGEKKERTLSTIDITWLSSETKKDEYAWSIVNAFDKDPSKQYEKLSTKYDKVLWSEYWNRGVFFVEKGSLYGIVSKNWDEIIPCKYPEYSDAYGEWKDLWFPREKPILTLEQKAVMEQRLALEGVKNDLMLQWHINRVSFYNKRTVNGTAFVKLPNWKIWMAASLIVRIDERGKELEILDENWEHLLFISEPELLQEDSGYLVITSDDENLYVGSYNTDHSYLAAYEMGSFERKRKTPMYGSSIQSVTVNDNYLMAFDMKDWKIKYFDKRNWQQLKWKDIDVRWQGWWSHHNLAATNESLIAAVPGFEEMIFNSIWAFNNELKVFDNEKAKLVAQTSFSAAMGSLDAVAVDSEKWRAFLAIGNKIWVFDSTGYIGMIPLSTRNIHQLDYSPQTGCLMVSMTEGKGVAEILDRKAINTLIEQSKMILWTAEKISIWK